MKKEDTTNSQLSSIGFWWSAKKHIATFTVAIISALMSLILLPLIFAMPIIIISALVAWNAYEDILDIKNPQRYNSK